MSWIILGILACIPMIGWWSSANAEKQATQRAQRAEGRAAESDAAASALRERLAVAEAQSEHFRSVLGDHPSLRRVK